jgi:hypothetical protein
MPSLVCSDAPVAQRDERRERETATGGVTGDHDRLPFRPIFEQTAICGQCVVERGGERVFRRKAVIERENPRPAACRKTERRRAMRPRRAEVVAATVQIENRRRVSAIGAFQPFATQRPVTLAIAFMQHPARRHARRVRALCGHLARAFGADRRMPRLRM